MRLRVPADSLVTDGLDVFPGTADSEMWLVRGDSEIAQRSGYAQRVFRDAHPLDDLPGLVDNGNGFRILVGALGLKALADDNTLLLPPSRTFAHVTNALVGGLNFSVQQVPARDDRDAVARERDRPGAERSADSAGDRHVEYSVGDYNVENLYDYRDDPFDGCDFTGNTGCPGVSPPFDYVPASDAVYQERLGLIAEQIVGDLHAPDVILVQEAEDQDICTVAAGALSCGAVEQRGRQARHAAGAGAPDRGAERDRLRRGLRPRRLRRPRHRRGADVPDRPRRARCRRPPTIRCSGSTPEVSTSRRATRTTRRRPEPEGAERAAAAGDLALPSSQRDGVEVYTRDPQVGLFRIWRTAVGVGAWIDVYAISNHFSSTPDARVAQRREQARYLARDRRCARRRTRVSSRAGTSTSSRAPTTRSCRRATSSARSTTRGWRTCGTRWSPRCRRRRTRTSSSAWPRRSTASS